MQLTSENFWQTKENKIDNRFAEEIRVSICNEIAGYMSETMLPKVWLEKIAIEGFKSYREQTTIPLSPSFSCIVGPNGSGKSVVGEAVVACLCGGNLCMLRVEKQSSLINQNKIGVGAARVSNTSSSSGQFLLTNIPTAGGRA